jgi:uracil-DNA glycosylase
MTGRRIELKSGADLAGFRLAVRALVAAGVEPSDVLWDTNDHPGLFEAETSADAPAISLPRTAHELIELAVCHRDRERYAELYELIWRLLHGEPHLLEVPSEPLVQRLEMKRKAIRRDLHKMHAFVRFRRVASEDDTERFVAWFEPDHYILEAAAPFFIERFRSLNWSILTPIGSLHWNRERLVVGPPARRGEAADHDPVEKAWSAYYESTFNPARLNVRAMRGHMPKKYWRNMSETAAIPDLVHSAPSRVREMIEREAAMPLKRDPAKAVAAMWDKEPKTIAELNAIIAASEPLVPGATKAVLGEGPIGAPIAFVGEQPGDQEDLQGHPFVGPAGQLLTRAMTEAGIDRNRVYVTNAVKHFKFEQRGKKRIHQKPTAGEIKHYRWWLEKELDLVHPGLVVALGATAVQALAGKALPITRVRGPASFDGHAGFITVHPSYLLRIPDEEAKAAAYRDFVSDLEAIRAMAENPARLQAATR